MGLLNDYLVWVRKTKATALNLSNLISQEVPKSAGQKGSTLRRKGGPKGKKKQILSEKDGIECVPIPSSLPNPPVPQTPLTALPTLPPSSASISTNTLPEVQPVSSSFPCPGAFSSPPVFPPVFSTPYSFPTSSSSSSVYPSALSPSTQALYYNQPTFNSHFYSLSQEHAVFCLKHLHGTRIRTCYGCGNPIRTDLSYIPPPPHDVVVSYRERWYYRDLITHEMRLTPNEENTYYHLMLWCITRKHPMFQGFMLKISESLLSLQDVHRWHIMEHFGIQL